MRPSGLLALLSLLLAAAGPLRAQRADSLSTASTEAFLEGLETLLEGGSRAETRELLEAFATRYSALPPAQQTLVTSTANAMLDAGMPAAPFFVDYLATVNALPADGEAAAATFDNWHEAAAGMLAAIRRREFKPYGSYLAFSRGFFTTGALRESGNVQWYARARAVDLGSEGGEPVLTFDTARLVGVRRLDSITVEGAAGRYFPMRETFEGERGRVYWTRVGDVDSYVTLGRYTIDVDKSLYQVDTVMLYNPKFFGERKVPGAFADRVTSSGEDATSTYPRFASFDNVLELGDLTDGLTYIGGFRMEGAAILGDAPAGKRARLEFRNESGKLRYRGVAPSFTLRRGERVVGQRVRSAYFFGADSITHPSVSARFDLRERTLTLTRGDRPADRNPFYSSLQDVNVDVDEVKIFLDRDSIVIGEGESDGLASTKPLGKSSSRVDIVSLQHFSAKDFNRYQNIATYNPLLVVGKVAEREGRTLDADALAAKIDPGFTTESVRSLYYDMVRDGFIDYDADSARVFVKEKLLHYVDAAAGRADFDNLQIRSDTKATNATFDARTGELLVNGVKNLELSRKQRVALVPTGQQLVLTGDRGVGFDGTLFAGYTVLEGKDFRYEYAPNQIALDSVRYFDIYTPQPPEQPGGDAPEPIGIASRIEHLAGTLLIDAPANKSGREEIPIFPSLQSRGPSYVYYDLPSNHDTAYVRDSFYFELAEFSFNSLDDFTDDDLRFGGTMYSAEIFPPYRDSVYVREGDRSLGHLAETPEAGWTMYGERGGFRGTVDLSNAGFLGRGTVDYLSAAISSDSIVLLPRGLTAAADNFDLAEERAAAVKTPYAKGRDVRIDWRPYRDSMYVSTDAPPFTVFPPDAGHTLDGELILTPGGLNASGTHDWPTATVRGGLLSYGPYSLQSDTLSLAIKSSDGSEVALRADNLRGELDFDGQRGSFTANDSVVTVALDANRMATSMKELDWDITAARINFGSPPGELGSFVSTDPERDSLTFRAATAAYELDTDALEVGGVPYVASADALIYPAGGKLSVGVGGQIATLTNARLVADTATEYHVFDSATVEVFGRKAYRASGKYRFDIRGREQTIWFDEVLGERVGEGARSEKAAVTRGTAELTAADDVYIDESTRFRGTVALDASRPGVTFDGFARVEGAKLPTTDWFSIQTPGVIDDLRLSYDLPQSPRGDDLYTGVFLSRANRRSYPLLFGPTTTGRDRAVFDLSAGLLDYRPDESTFVVGDSLRVVGASARGRIGRFDAATGAFEGHGRLDLGSGLDYISIKAAGDIATAIKPEDALGAPLTAEVLLSVDLIIPEKLLNLIAADLQASGFDAPDVQYRGMTTFLPEALTNWTDDLADSTSAEAARAGSFVLPKGEPKHAFVFPRLPLVYNHEYQSFFSAETKVDLAYVNGAAIHKRLDAYIEVKMPGSGDDRLYVYLKSPSESFYFFGFKQGILNVASSSARFMESLESLKAKELTKKMDDGEVYEIAPVNTGTANSFVARVREARSEQ